MGCDASTAGHFLGIDTEEQKKNDQQCIGGDVTYNKWKELKHFLELHDPDVEIISINPVGLKGLFKDVYQNKI